MLYQSLTLQPTHSKNLNTLPRHRCKMATELSVVITAYNEQDNIQPLTQELIGVLNSYGKPYEIIFIDDGSTDATAEKIALLHEKNRNIRMIQFRKNFGQTAALDAGFKNAKGKVIIPMDADMQNDPQDIPKLMAGLNGLDVIVGWRKNRKDHLPKKLASLFANT